VAFAGTSPAGAWTPIGWVASCERPQRWALARDAEGHGERHEAAVRAAFEVWGTRDGQCHRFEYQGLVDGPAEPFVADGVWTVRFAADGGPLPSMGVMASMPRLSKGPRLELAGLSLFELVENDIVLHAGVPWIAAAGLDEDCHGALVIEHVLGHEIARSLGLQPPPDGASSGGEGGPVLRWPMETCSARAAAPGPDERAGLDALYGGRSVELPETAVLPGSEGWLLRGEVEGLAPVEAGP